MDYEILNEKIRRSEIALQEYREFGLSIDQRAKILYENLLKVRSDTKHTSDVNMFEINLRADAVIDEYSDLFF